jgi:iron(III) transport system substrate-binding protein
VLQRAVTEARGNRHTVDVCETNGPEMEALSREKLLERVKSPYLADLIAPALRPHGEWVGTRLNVFVQAYNTQAVKKEELPEDLGGPRQPEVEGQARHRAGGFRLARRRVRRAG